jgi:hypothetical protein
MYGRTVGVCVAAGLAAALAGGGAKLWAQPGASLSRGATNSGKV